jgi:hypothetical protein
MRLKIRVLGTNIHLKELDFGVNQKLPFLASLRQSSDAGRWTNRASLSAFKIGGSPMDDEIFTDAVCADEIAVTYAGLATPNQAMIDALLAMGIEPDAFISDWRGASADLRTALVSWQGNRFEFADDGRSVLIVMAFDEVGDLGDLVAFNSRGQIGTWLGRLPVLGLENALSPRMAEGLMVHKSALDWLRNYRKGVVIIDGKRASIALECSEPLIAADASHAAQLRALLRHEPRIIVARQKGAANAAA